MRNPHVVELASLIGRSAGAVSYKLANFARLDPTLQARGIRGLEHGAKGEIAVWKEFYDDPEALVLESERLLSERKGTSIEQNTGIDESGLPQEGLERERIVRLRVNQRFFRTAVLTAYGSRCCITGIKISELLVASHIVPWSVDKKNRVNPSNGLCLNALHDRAYDRGLMTVMPDGKVRFAKSLHSQHSSKDTGLSWLISFDGKRINMPTRFRPDPMLLAQHVGQVFTDENV